MLRVLTFLKYHPIPLRWPGEYRKPTQQEAYNMYHIPQRTISTWVKKREMIERVGKNSHIKEERTNGNTQRVLWPELEEWLHSEFLERRRAARTVRQSWFRIHSQFLCQSLYPNVNSAVFWFSNS